MLSFNYLGHNRHPVIICGRWNVAKVIKGYHICERADICFEVPLRSRPDLLLYQTVPLPIHTLFALISIVVVAV